MEYKQIRVLHIITGLGTGGAETALYRILPKMDKTRFFHSVISLTEEGTIGERIKQSGISVHSIGMPRGIPSIRGITALIKIARSFKPDVIQTWMYHGNIAGTICAMFMEKRIPVCWNVRHSLHELKNEKRSTRLIIRLNALFSRFASVIVYNSYTASVQHTNLGFSGKSVCVIPNGFDISIYTANLEKKNEYRKMFSIHSRCILIGLFGRYHPLKDHETFLKAASLVVNKTDKVMFLCAGIGVTPDNSELMTLIKELNLSDRIFLLGERQDIPSLTAALDIEVLSSKSEAFPNVVGEAMSCEVPCVVTDVGDTSVIVGDTGVIVPPKNPEALASGILTLIDAGPAARREMGKHARKIIIENYSIDAIAKRYEKLYTGLFKNNHA